MARTVKDLIEHMQKYKDAVIIFGSNIEKDAQGFSKEKFNEFYTRKNLVRNPEMLWTYFLDEMYVEPSERIDAVKRQVEKMDDVIGTIVNQSMFYPNLNKSISLHGSIDRFVCSKCKTEYTIDYITSKEPFEHECELCDGHVRPTALLSGERYVKADFDAVKEAIKNTHTLFLIGMDYTEKALMEMITEYADVTSFNADTSEEEHMLVAVQSSDEEFNPNEMAFFNFIVKDDVAEAMKRLVEAF